MKSSLQNRITTILPFFDLKIHFKNFKKQTTLWLFAFFTTFILNFSANAQALQPADCGHITCTSNDVRIISAYISGPGDAPINCADAQPFHNAELHLIVVTNTPRIGVSISGFLKIDDNSIPLAQCFTGTSLNDNSPNNLVYNLGSSLDDVQCGEHDFSLTNIFIAWGTGNTDFCTGTAAQCPATPSKCRFKEGEIIEVDVKLDVDFDLTVGNCGQDPSNLTVTLTPTVTAENITYPLSFDWDFGDGSAHATTSAASLADVPNAGTTHTYANADTYTITLTVTDNSDPVVTRTAIHHITLVTCCNLSAPSVIAGPFCASDNKKIADLPQNDGSGGIYLWFASSDPNDDNDIPLAGTTVIPVGTTTYYVSLSSGGCESPRAAVTIIINALPTITGTPSVCAGSTTQLTGSGTANATTPWSSDNTPVATVSLTGLVTGVSAGTATITYTDNNGCSTSVTVTVKPLPTVPITVGTQTCTGGVAQFVLSTTSNGTTIAWSKSVGADGSFSSTSSSPTTYTPGNNDKTNGVTITLTATLDGCTNSSSVTLKPAPCGPYYTYTQGYYSSTGTSCTPVGGVKGSVSLIQYSISALPGGKLYLGASGHSFTAFTADASKLVAIMPGGGNADKLAKDYNLSTTSSYPPLKNGKINNVLLSQTITLAMNVNIQGDGLRTFILKSGYLTTQKGDLSTCPSNKVVHCSKDASAISSLKITANATLMNLLNGKTVNDLLTMASNALGGTTISGVSLTDINNAVDAINKSFDGGRFFLGYYSTQQSCATLPSLNTIANPITETIQNKPLITTYPNPFNDKIRFVIQSPVSGKGRLEVFDMLGQKLKTVFDGQIFAGMEQSVEFNVPPANRTNLIYILRINDQQVVGKLLNVKQ